MTGRTVLALTLTLGLLTGPLVADAQQPKKIFRIGYLGSVPPTTPEISRIWEGFRQGLRELGYVEGQNIVIERRFSEGRYERYPALAAELAGLKPDVIVAVTTQAALAAKNATKTIPIVFTIVGDPVGVGLVASLARPGGNITGFSNVSVPLSAKQLELIKETVPGLSRVAVLVNPDTLPLHLSETEAAARALKVQVQPHRVRDPDGLPDAFSAMVRERAGALMVLADTMFFLQRKRIAELATKARLPTMLPFREAVEAGGLMSYGASIPELVRRAATYVDKILKGAKPADLPVEEPTKFELVINMKTAKALGLTIPQSVLVRADQVIE